MAYSGQFIGQDKEKSVQRRNCETQQKNIMTPSLPAWIHLFAQNFWWQQEKKMEKTYYKKTINVFKQ